MAAEETGGTERFKVVVNGEDQYSIWSAGCELPAGWSEVGFDSPKAECLSYAEQVWVAMRPKSLRPGPGEQAHGGGL